MSNWTHVAGIIRIDDLGRILSGKRLDFENLIDLPYGSEGSLNMTVWENPEKSSLNAYTVSIFGDLRDHYSAEEIIEWFKDVCKNFSVRNATITAQNEWYGTANWFYNDD